MFKILKYLAVFFFVVALSWGVGFIHFVNSLPIVSSDPFRQTDAIVVWTGGTCRVATGLELLSSGISDKLFISGAKGDKAPDLIEKNFHLELTKKKVDALIARTQVGSLAQTTIGNAIETAHWVKENNIKTIRLVTSSMHIPRSLLECERYLSNVTIIVHPVEIDKFNHTHWYKEWNVFTKVALEYTKYLSILMGFRFQLKDNLSPQQ